MHLVPRMQLACAWLAVHRLPTRQPHQAADPVPGQPPPPDAGDATFAGCHRTDGPCATRRSAASAPGSPRSRPPARGAETPARRPPVRTSRRRPSGPPRSTIARRSDRLRSPTRAEKTAPPSAHRSSRTTPPPERAAQPPASGPPRTRRPAPPPPASSTRPPGSEHLVLHRQRVVLAQRVLRHLLLEIRRETAPPSGHSMPPSRLGIHLSPLSQK